MTNSYRSDRPQGPLPFPARGHARTGRTSLANGVLFPLLAVCFVLSACDSGETATQDGSAQVVTAKEIEERPVERVLSASGIVVAWEEVPVGSELGGLAVTAVAVEEGAKIKQGDVLAQLNDAVLKAQMAGQDAAVTRAEATLQLSRADLKRARELRPKGTISARALDSQIAETKIEAARHAEAEALAAETSARLAQTRIIAPVDGYVSKRDVVVGQIVRQGEELFRLIRDSKLELAAEVTEDELLHLKPGQKARVDIVDGVAVEGEVRLVSPRIDAQTRVAIVRITLDPSDQTRPGMFGKARISLSAVPGIRVPQSALVFRNGKPVVFVVGPDGTASAREVRAGARFEGDVVVEEGLTGGETVIVKGAGFLFDGDRIRVIEETPAEPSVSSVSSGNTRVR